MTAYLDRITSPKDLRSLSDAALCILSDELRGEVVEAVSKTGGHLGSS